MRGTGFGWESLRSRRLAQPDDTHSAERPEPRAQLDDHGPRVLLSAGTPTFRHDERHHEVTAVPAATKRQVVAGHTRFHDPRDTT